MGFDKTELSSIKDNAIVVIKLYQLLLTLNTYPIVKNNGGYNSRAKFTFVYSKSDNIFKSLFNNYLESNSQLASYDWSKNQQSEHESAFQAINSYRILIANKQKLFCDVITKSQFDLQDVAFSYQSNSLEK